MTQKRILLVEDDTFLREILAKMLRDRGYVVEEAISGEIGIEKYQESPPDMILLDVVLPGIDGLEILDKLAGANRKVSCPIIILSNFGDESHIERAKRKGVKEYFIKAHMSLKEIVEKIDALILESNQ